MTVRHQELLAGSLAVLLGASALVGASSPAGAATPPKETAAKKKLPVYEFLRKSGFSKRAKPEAAVVRGVLTVTRGGRQVVTSTVRSVYHRYQPETLEAIQAAIVNGTPVEAREDNPKVGSIEIAYNDGKKLTVIIYKYYYEITASAGTIRFTSKPLNTLLYDLLQ